MTFPDAVTEECLALVLRTCISTAIVQVKTDIAPPGEQAVTGSGDKLKKGAGETIPDLDAWTAHKTEDGAIYYYNSLSCQSTYTRPVEFKGEVA
jgi:hypothetical protein